MVPYVGRVRENRLWAGLEKIKKETGARPQTIDSLSHLGFLVLVDSELVFLVLPVSKRENNTGKTIKIETADDRSSLGLNALTVF